MKAVFVNLSFFKIGWLASVFSAAASMPVIGIIVVGLAVGAHLWLADDSHSELKLLAFAACLGLLWESFLVATGLVRYEASAMLPGLAPYWIVGMWVLFATTLNVGMRWLRKNVAVAATAGAAGGPLSFLAGEKMGAVGFANTSLALFIIGLGWAVLLPVLVHFATRNEDHVAATVPDQA
ncbi:MAG: DUF2878 domain-containing protein [Woeseiaceae bacterium]